MKIRTALVALSVTAIIALAGCSNNTLKKDVEPLADAMCRFIELENKLKAVQDTADSVTLAGLMDARKQLTIEMTVLNKEFQDKYGDKIKDADFGKKFGKIMNDQLLECPHLSKEDRDRMMQAHGGK